MTNPTKYFVSNSTGVFINWYSDVLGLGNAGQSILATGSSGDDSIYVGAGTVVDARGLTSTVGNDSIYLTGDFSDYTQTNNGPTYTLTRTVTVASEEYTESVTFSLSNNDKLYFADGSINIGYTDLSGFPALTSGMLNVGEGETTPQNPLDVSIPAVQAGGATKVFISDSEGALIAAGVRGSVFEMTGGVGDDIIQVGEGTVVDATRLTSTTGNDRIHMLGDFDDYTHTNAGPTYLVSREVTIDGQSFTESVTFSTSTGDRIYFANGFIPIGTSDLPGFPQLTEALLNTSELAPFVESVVISGAEPDGTLNTDTLIIGDQVLVTVTANKPITVDTTDGTPTYTINIGGAEKLATYVSGSGADTLVFAYTLVEGDLDTTGGITASADALSLASGTLTDNDGLTLDLSTPAIIEGANNIQVDAVSPVVDTLVVSTDGIVTSNDTLTAVAFSGTTTGVEDGQSITVVIGEQTVTVEVENNAFTGTVDLSEVTDSDALAVSATVSDLAGNAAEQYSANIILNTSAPTPTIALATDTGSNTSDGVTSDATVNVSGLEAGSTWQYSTDNGTTWSSAANTDETLAATFELDDAFSGDVIVRQTDAHGNISESTAALSVVVDTVDPTIETLLVSTDGIVTSSDTLTAVAFSGATTGVEDGQSITVVIGGQTVTLEVQSNEFTGEVDLSTVDDSDTVAVTAAVSDLAGNAAEQYSANIILNTSAPTPTIALATDTGSNTTDGVTSDATVTVSGLEADSTWQYSTDNGTSWSTEANTDETLAATFELDDAFSGDVIVRQTDAHGNISESTAALSVVVDTVDPTIETLIVSGDDIVTGADTLTTVAFSGTTTGVENGQSITVVIGGQTVTLEVQSNEFTGEVDLSTVDDSDTVAVTAAVSDLAGNVAAQYSANIVLNTSAPTPTIALAADTGSNTSDGVTSHATVTVSGLEADSTWQYSTDNGTTWSTEANTDETLAATFELDDAFSGDVIVRQTDAHGNISESTAALSVVVDTTALAPTIALATDTGSDTTDGVTNDATVTVSGLEEGATWQYSTDNGSNWVEGSLVGSDGTASFELSDSFNGSVIARQTDLAGNVSTNSAELAVVIDTQAPTASTTPITGDDFGDSGYNQNDTISLQFSEPVDIANLTLDVLNANLSNTHIFGTGANGASISASNEVDGGATLFVITLGSDASVDVNDILTLPAATVVDLNGNQAATEVVFTIPIPASGPTAALTDAINVTDTDDNGSYSAQDTITVSFSSPVLVTNLTLEQFILSANDFGTGATVAAVDASGDYAASFVITLGDAPTVTQSDQISVSAISVVDESGRAATEDVTFDLLDITPASAAPMNAIVAHDVDANSGFSEGDTLNVTFDEALSIIDLTTNVGSAFSIESGHSLGEGFSVAAVGSANGFSTQFTITLGASPTLVATDTLSVANNRIIDAAGNSPATDVAFSVPSVLTPAAADSDSVSQTDTNTDGIYNAEDTITVRFNKPVNTSLSIDDFSIAGKTFGAGATLVAVGASDEGYATEFTLTLKNGTDVEQGDQISVDGSQVIDDTSTSATGNVVFMVADITPPEAAGDAVPTDVGADNVGVYGEGDTLTINFSEAVNVANLADDDLGVAITLIGTGTNFGIGANIVATNAEITVDNIDSDVNGVYTLVPFADVANLSLTGDFDPEDVNTANTIDASKPVYSLTNSDGETWYLWARTDSGYHISKLDSTEKWFWENGTDASGPENVDLWMQASGDASREVASSSTPIFDFTVDGLATQFTITLGAGTDIVATDLITIDAANVVDGAGNEATVDQTFNVPAAGAPSIVSMSAPDGHYESGEEIVITVTFSENVTVNLNNSTMTMLLDVGGSEVLAEYTGGSGSTDLTFSYSASGVLDADGITVLDNSIDVNLGSITNAAGDEAELAHAEQAFENVTVDAPFSVATAAAVWLDGMDVDGDGANGDQQAGDIVSQWRDKSGNNHHVEQVTSGSQPVLESDSNITNGHLAVKFDGNDQLLLNEQISAATSYTYFTVGHVSSITSEDEYETLFTTRDGSSEGLAARSGREVNYDVYTKVTSSFDVFDTPENSYQANQPALLGDTAIAGGNRTATYNGDVFGSSDGLSPVAGSVLSVGALADGSQSLTGYVSEIVFYNRALNSAESTVVQNYLSSKWGTDLNASVDYYDGDTAANGDYDLYVTGILKLSDANVAAGSQGGLTITNGDMNGYLKDAGDSVFAGYKGSGMSTDDLPEGIANVRSDTVWYFDATDVATAGGTINLGFDLDQLGLVATDSSDDYVLLWRSHQTGQFHEIAVADSLTGNTISFDGIEVNTAAADGMIQTSTNMINDGYFTVGAVDNTAPVYESAEAEIGGNIITLTFNKNLNSESIPDVSAFGVDVAGNRAVTAVVIVGQNVILTIDGEVLTTADTVRTSYTNPETGAVLEDVAGNSLLGNTFIVGTSLDDAIQMDSSNEIVHGRGGNDIFVYSTDSDVRTDGDLSIDTIADFTLGTDSGDQLNLSELLSYTAADSLSNFIQVIGGNIEGGDVTINVDKDGSNNFSTPDQAIVLSGVGSNNEPITLDFLNDYNLTVL